MRLTKCLSVLVMSCNDETNFHELLSVYGRVALLDKLASFKCPANIHTVHTY